MSAEKRTNPSITDNSLSQTTKWYVDSKFCLVFKRSCLKQKNATYTPSNRVIYFIVYELDTWSRDLHSSFTLKDCLVGGINLAIIADPDKCVYTGYGIGFDSLSAFSLPDGSMGRNFIVFGIDMSSFVYIDKKGKIS